MLEFVVAAIIIIKIMKGQRRMAGMRWPVKVIRHLFLFMILSMYSDYINNTILGTLIEINQPNYNQRLKRDNYLASSLILCQCKFHLCGSLQNHISSNSPLRLEHYHMPNLVAKPVRDFVLRH